MARPTATEAAVLADIDRDLVDAYRADEALCIIIRRSLRRRADLDEARTIRAALAGIHERALKRRETLSVELARKGQ
jgi:hypothetical protein